MTSRDLGVVRVIATGAATSQQEIGALLGIDRTSMVAMLDDLEDRGLVRRQPSPHDRRRNVLALTPEGERTYQDAEREIAVVDAKFLEPLSSNDSRRFARALRTLLDAADGADRGPG
nr:MarR family transcriptional regulator [Nakamurella flavida]